MTDAVQQAVKGHKRWWLWLPLLGVGGWLALLGDKSPARSGAEVSLPTRTSMSSNTGPGTAGPGAPVKAAAPVPGEILLPLIARKELIADARELPLDKQPSRDLFTVRNWNPPPPPSPSVVPAPTAPPLPFSFLGKKLESDVWEVYLGQGDQTHVVREGQVLHGVYRVDKIEPPTLALTYMPLGEAQTLPIGDNR